MCRSDPDLVGAGMSDPVVTPERARLITGYDEVRAAAFDAGATGVTVSGAGPAILAVCRDGQRRGSPPRCSTLSPTLASTPAPTRRGSGGGRRCLRSEAMTWRWLRFQSIAYKSLMTDR